MPPPADRQQPAGQALDGLRYIRATLERSGSLASVPGWGNVAMGVAAFGAAPVAAWQTDRSTLLGAWLGSALVAVVVSPWAVQLTASLVWDRDSRDRANAVRPA